MNFNFLRKMLSPKYSIPAVIVVAYSIFFVSFQYISLYISANTGKSLLVDHIVSVGHDAPGSLNNNTIDIPVMQNDNLSNETTDEVKIAPSPKSKLLIKKSNC